MAGATIEFGDPAQPSHFFEDPDAVEGPLLVALLDGWRAARKGRSIPLYADFVPRDVKVHLPWIIVIDALPDYVDFRYRVIGTKVCEYFLSDGTGKTISEAYGDLRDLAENIKFAYRRTCTLGRPTRCKGPASTYGGIFFPPFDSLFLPYSRFGETADCIVNAFSFCYEQFLAHRSHAGTSLLNASKLTLSSNS